MAERKKGLGRGIATLIGSNPPNVGDLSAPKSVRSMGTSQGDGGDNALTSDTPKTLPVAYLSPGTSQPRQYFDQEKLAELSQSMQARGVIQPLIVKQTGTNSYDIIAGERRWRAAQLAGLHDVPVVIQDFSDQEALEVGLVENIQRADLTAYEEAIAYQKLIDQFSYTQKDIADKVGKSRSHVANLLRLLTLPKAVIDHIQTGALSMGHARALIGQENAEALADRIINDGLTVRQIEALTSNHHSDKPGKKSEQANTRNQKDADTRALEKQISAALGMKASINHKGESGTLSLSYETLDQLDEFLNKIGSVD